MYQDISFFNEVTEFLESVYDQITQRTSEHIFVDYNPSKKFWLDKYKNNPNTILIHSTYKDNPFLSQGIIDKIESYNPAVERNVELQTADDYMWKVYGLGTLAEKPNRIYKGWRTCSKTYYKDLEYQEYFGLDFGLSNPTALIGVKWDGHRTFYIHEYLYMPSSFMNMPIYKWIQEKIPDVTTNNLVIADSAKQSMVDDMAGAGFLCVGAIKGAGSVDFGINILQSFNVVYTESSHNLDEEYVGYSYMVDRYGLTTDAVVRKDDHLLDALRYCVTYLQKYLDIKI
jgi:phage terminase large subunit